MAETEKTKQKARSTKQLFIEQVKAELGTNIHSVSYTQQRPWTYCEVKVWVGDSCYLAVGFSKVCYPDPWSEELGKRIALDKALAHVYKQVLGRDVPAIVWSQA